MRIYGNIDMYVGKIVALTKNVKRFYLYPTDNKLLPAFTGGAHITTIINSDESVIERDYSLVSHPTNRSHYSISVNRDINSRGGSVYWHDQIKEGDTLQITPPKNHFALSFRAKHHVFYAAGIGITPFLTMMEDLKSKGQSFELHYAAQTPESCAYYDYLLNNYPGKVHFYFSKTDQPNRLTPDIMKSHRIGSHVYFCGPSSMVNEYRNAAISYGYPLDSIHFEVFGLAEGPRMPFKVILPELQKEIEVSEKETLLDALLAAGVDAPYSCKGGGCGQCEIEVISGEVDHRDIFYSDQEREERKVILTCCSRSKNADEALVLSI